jgi:regulator of sirC expression with transglutaminase-like and TPR domain
MLAAFAALVARPDDEIDLAVAALLIAEMEYPGLELAPYLARLDDLAARARGRDLAEFLFADEGFAGNRDHYEDARNSLLNDVLDRRTGIPITLSVVYLEVGWRLGLAVEGINYPGHFLVRAGDRILDCFNGGREVDPTTLSAEGVVVASRRQILRRMLVNLSNLTPRRRWLSDFQGALDAKPSRSGGVN